MHRLGQPVVCTRPMDRLHEEKCCLLKGRSPIYHFTNPPFEQDVGVEEFAAHTVPVGLQSGEKMVWRTPTAVAKTGALYEHPASSAPWPTSTSEFSIVVRTSRAAGRWACGHA